MKKIFITAAVCIISTYLHAQTIERQVIGSAGGYSTATGIQVSSSTGEAVIATGTSGSIVLTQGFEQPDSVGTNAVQNISINNATLKVYPNPTQGSVILDITVTQPATYTITVYDAVGRALTTEQPISVTARETKRLDFSSYAAGNYIVAVRSGNEMKSIKVVKQ